MPKIFGKILVQLYYIGLRSSTMVQIDFMLQLSVDCLETYRAALQVITIMRSSDFCCNREPGLRQVRKNWPVSDNRPIQKEANVLVYSDNRLV